MPRSGSENSPLRHNPPNGGGGFHLLKVKRDDPEPATSPRKPARQCVSRPTRDAAAAALRGRPRARYAERTVEHYLARRALLARLARRAGGRPSGRAERATSRPTRRTSVALRKKDGRPYAVGSQQAQLIAMKSFFRFLYRRRRSPPRPGGGGRARRGEERLPRVVLTEEEARRLVAAAARRSARGLRDRAILETLYATGIRAGELAGLTAYDVDTEERLLRVVMGKGRKDRNVPLTRAAARAIEEYLANGAEARGAVAGPEAVSPRSFSSWPSTGGKLKRAVVGKIIARLDEEGGDREARHLPHLPPQRRDAPPAGRGRHPAHPGAPGPRVLEDDRALHAGRDRGPEAGGASARIRAAGEARVDAPASGVPRAPARRRLLGLDGRTRAHGPPPALRSPEERRAQRPARRPGGRPRVLPRPDEELAHAERRAGLAVDRLRLSHLRAVLLCLPGEEGPHPREPRAGAAAQKARAAAPRAERGRGAAAHGGASLLGRRWARATGRSSRSSTARGSGSASACGSTFRTWRFARGSSS